LSKKTIAPVVRPGVLYSHGQRYGRKQPTIAIELDRRELQMRGGA
jgi:hypothetical protein